MPRSSPLTMPMTVFVRLPLCGTVRVVEVRGFDIEACCGTHCDNTSQVGLVRLTRTHRVSDGAVRLHFVAGLRALEHTQTVAGAALVLLFFPPSLCFSRSLPFLLKAQRTAHGARQGLSHCGTLCSCCHSTLRAAHHPRHLPLQEQGRGAALALAATTRWGGHETKEAATWSSPSPTHLVCVHARSSFGRLQEATLLRQSCEVADVLPEKLVDTIRRFFEDSKALQKRVSRGRGVPHFRLSFPRPPVYAHT